MRDRIKMSQRDEFMARYKQANSLGERFAHVIYDGGVGATLFLLSRSDVDVVGRALVALCREMEVDARIIWGDPDSPEPVGVLDAFEATEREAARREACKNLGPDLPAYENGVFVAPEPSPKAPEQTATVLQSDQADGVATCA